MSNSSSWIPGLPSLTLPTEFLISANGNYLHLVVQAKALVILMPIFGTLYIHCISETWSTPFLSTAQAIISHRDHCSDSQLVSNSLAPAQSVLNTAAVLSNMQVRFCPPCSSAHPVVPVSWSIKRKPFWDLFPPLFPKSSTSLCIYSLKLPGMWERALDSA